VNDIPIRQIRAQYDESTIRVYQAYSDAIADAALERQKFVSPPFKMERMTWIKPSFLWMMYRAGWGEKEEGQKRILAIDITRKGFEWALTHSCPSHPEPGMDEVEWEKLKGRSPVRIQWDPERDLFLKPLPHRAIQVGLGKEAVRSYVGEWIQAITDISNLARSIHDLVKAGSLEQANAALPSERPYPWTWPRGA
jgi:hypothetical protein